MRACDTSLDELGTVDGRENVICVKFACGECRSSSCEADHCAHRECPKDWVTATATKLRNGTTKLREEEAAADGSGTSGRV